MLMLMAFLLTPELIFMCLLTHGTPCFFFINLQCGIIAGFAVYVVVYICWIYISFVKPNTGFAQLPRLHSFNNQ